MKNVLRFPVVGLAAVGILLTILLKLATKSLMLMLDCFLTDLTYINKTCSSSLVLNLVSNTILMVFQSMVEPSSRW